LHLRVVLTDPLPVFSSTAGFNICISDTYVYSKDMFYTNNLDVYYVIFFTAGEQRLSQITCLSEKRPTAKTTNDNIMLSSMKTCKPRSQNRSSHATVHGPSRFLRLSQTLLAPYWSAQSSFRDTSWNKAKTGKKIMWIKLNSQTIR